MVLWSPCRAVGQSGAEAGRVRIRVARRPRQLRGSGQLIGVAALCVIATGATAVLLIVGGAQLEGPTLTAPRPTDSAPGPMRVPSRQPPPDKTDPGTDTTTPLPEPAAPTSAAAGQPSPASPPAAPSEPAGLGAPAVPPAGGPTSTRPGPIRAGSRTPAATGAPSAGNASTRAPSAGAPSTGTAAPSVDVAQEDLEVAPEEPKSTQAGRTGGGERSRPASDSSKRTEHQRGSPDR